jgi:uncharacterized membrane protein YraQ (UPF0718 family)
MLTTKRKDACELHGAGTHSSNRTLLSMVGACLILIVWHVWAYGPSTHFPAAGVVAESLPLQVARELWDLIANKHGIWAELRDVFPYFMVGILLAGYLRTYKIAVKLQASLRRYGALSVVIASLVGIITPLCACGTLTTAVSLLFAGLPLAPVIAILVTSPLMSPSAYLLTLNDLGPEWTVIRTIAAFSMGIFAGYVTHFLCLRGFDKGGVFIEGGIVRGDFHDEDYPDERLRCNCREKFGNRVAVRTSNKFLIFLAKSVEMLWVVGKYVLVGVVIGAIVERYMPYEWIYRFFGRQDPLNILWVTLGSVPLFLHQISASSILVHIKNSLHGTLDGGAGLAFIIGGPVTAIPTMILFWTFFKKRFFFLYMFVCLVGTILISLLFQQFIFVPGVDTGNQLFRGVSHLAGGRSASIVKEGERVKIALDPQGKSIVATYSNDVDSHGGMVFDAGFARFARAASSIKDDSRYVANVADWLEQANLSQEKGKILLYLVAGTGTASNDMLKGVASVLRHAKFAVTVANRRDMPQMTERIIAEHGQIWLFVAGSDPSQHFSAQETDILTKAVKSGKSMMVALDPVNSATIDTTAANQIANHFGVRFSGFVDNGQEIPIAIGASFFASAAEMLGKVLKVVNKA